MNNTEFLFAVIANLRRSGRVLLDSSDETFHEAMGAAISAVGKEKLNSIGVQLYFDPISKTVGELYHMASLLQSYKLARRPNPSFAALTLSIDKNACDELTSNLNKKELDLAKSFAKRVQIELNAETA